MSTDLNKGETYFDFAQWDLLVSIDTTFRVKKVTSATLTSDDIEVDDMPALIPIDDEMQCCPHCPFHPARVKSKL
ncbi:hypothetical protein B0H16DRAFT_1732005 [Mycena metata]|uniref:Uncharacterized protein n=1 Tax=Mycena metata TaxID=1033252 RepID=A0AAD7I3T1_9AGAR|nr:hypothetical protein B0H16DRAFT_1732005 [Mycena metata]